MEQRKDIMTGIIRILILFIVGSIFLAIAGYILSFVIDIIGRIIVFVLQWAVFGGIAWYGYKYFKKPKPKEKPAEVIPEEAIRLYTSSGQPIVYFPFVFYLAPYYEYVASYLSNSASLRVKYGFANGD